MPRKLLVFDKSALWMEGKQYIFTPQADWAVTGGAYVACHVGFKDEIGPVRIVQGLN